MRTFRQTLGRVSAFGLIALTSACAQTGGLGSVLGSILNQGQGQPSGGNGSGDVVAEVQSVDTRNQAIQVRTQNNQTANVYYDNRTQVVYNNQGYSVTALERGDVVNMRISQTGNNQYYTDYIQVTQSAQQRGATGGGTSGGGAYGNVDPNQLYNVAGNVNQVDYQRGLFTVRDNNGNVTPVAMPYNATRTDAARFQQLRSGDYVRLRGRWVSRERFELVGFQ